ncbi:ImuA family protein [Rhizorhabdus histidinilytica]|uniref:ImuA family protein n=1 Tax=Rhizorhabdus histidinilytica TaxID=439228 RepID=UPI00321F9D83
MRESPSILAALRARVGAIEGPKPAEGALFALGAADLDAQLGGGLPKGRLHELFAAEADDRAALAGAALMLAMRAGGGAGSEPLLWLRQEGAVKAAGTLYGPGLADLGLDPARLIEVVAPDEPALLRAAGDAVRCPQVGALLIEPWKAARGLDLTASRRLAVAAEKSGVTVLLLRAEAEPGPSAAYSRWRVRSRASAALEAGAPGHPAIGIELLRHRGGLDGLSAWLEWNRDEHSFEQAPLSGAVLPLPAGRPAGAGGAAPERLSA